MRCKELRAGHRHPVDFTAYIMWNGRLIESSAINISPQGILLECSAFSSPEGTEIRICAIVARRYYELAGRVAHAGQGRLGIRFNLPQVTFHQAALARSLQFMMETAHASWSRQIRTADGTRR